MPPTHTNRDHDVEKHKLEKLASLKDEVREFQPLLYTLFGRLPGVTHVERRQGPHEMGADFVITKTDATLFDHVFGGLTADAFLATDLMFSIDASGSVRHDRLVVPGGAD